MKQFIVLISMAGLGVFLYTLIAGQDDGSMMSLLRSWFQAEAGRAAG